MRKHRRFVKCCFLSVKKRKVEIKIRTTGAPAVLIRGEYLCHPSWTAGVLQPEMNSKLTQSYSEDKAQAVAKATIVETHSLHSPHNICAHYVISAQIT